MILVFDLDDTLYDELTYVESGFKAVSAYLFKECRIPPGDSLRVMMEELNGGRGAIFDDLLARYGLRTKQRVRQCLAVYRGHFPSIRLDKTAAECLERFRSTSKYIVTDGNKLVQANKIKALGLADQLNGCYITHRFGVKNAKPSPYCFLKICEKEKVEPGEIVYIADNPKKDFVGIKPLGFKTIRVIQGQHREVQMPAEFEAEWRIKSLDELTEELLSKLTVNQ